MCLCVCDSVLCVYAFIGGWIHSLDILHTQQCLLISPFFVQLLLFCSYLFSSAKTKTHCQEVADKLHQGKCVVSGAIDHHKTPFCENVRSAGEQNARSQLKLRHHKSTFRRVYKKINH